MKDYLIIHINKNTIKAIGKYILLIAAVLTFAFMFICTLSYICNGDYDDGYNALANEIKNGMSRTECGNYIFLSMKEFEIKLYQEQCLNFYDPNINHNTWGNAMFVSSEIDDE